MNKLTERQQILLLTGQNVGEENTEVPVPPPIVSPPVKKSRPQPVSFSSPPPTPTTTPTPTRTPSIHTTTEEDKVVVEAETDNDAYFREICLAPYSLRTFFEPHLPLEHVMSGVVDVDVPVEIYSKWSRTRRTLWSHVKEDPESYYNNFCHPGEKMRVG